MDKVNNGNVTLGSVNLGFRKRDELTSMSAAAHSGIVVFSFTHLVEVDGGSVVVVLEEMVVTHTDLTEVTRVVLKHSKSAPLSNHCRPNRTPSLPHRNSHSPFPINLLRILIPLADPISPLLNPIHIPDNCNPTNLVEVGPVVVLTTSQTTTTGVLPVLADTTVTGRDVTSVLSGVAESGRHSG